MRESLTIFAAFLIACLSIALAAPYVIDWNAQRGLAEAYLSKALGEKVSIHGNMDLKLLPVPYLHLQNFEIRDEVASAHFTADDVFLEIAIPPLLRGDVDFIEANIKRPYLKLIQAAGGTFQLPRPGVVSGQARFERIGIEDAKLEIADPVQSRNLILNHLDLNAEAASLDGPFKGDGAMVIADEKTAFRFSTGARDGSNLRLKLIAGQTKTHPRGDVDGTLSFRQVVNGSVAIAFAGNAAFSGLWHGGANQSGILLPWHLSGPLRIASNKMVMDTLDVRLGDEDHAVNAAGTGELDFSAAPKASLTLHARQIDIDRLLAEPAGPQQAQSFLHLSQAVSLLTFPLPLALDATAETATLNDEILTGLSGALIFNKDKPLGLRFEGSLPGRSQLRLNGHFEPGSPEQFSGQADLNASEFGQLAEWLSGLLPDEAETLRKLPFHSLDISGTADVSQMGFSGQDLKVHIGDSTLMGNLSYAHAIGSEPARLFIDAMSPSLDLDGWPDLQGALRFTQATDLSIRFEARTVRFAALNGGTPDTGEIKLKLTKTGQETTLEDISLTGFNGATIAAHGLWKGQTGNLDAKFKAPQLAGITAFLQHLAPNEWLDMLGKRTAILSPLQLDIHAEAAADPQASSLPELTALTLKGLAGRTSFKADINRDAKTPAASLSAAVIDAPDSAVLLSQLGAHVLPIDGLGRAHIDIKMQGPLTQSPDTELRATLAGLAIDFHGRAGIPAIAAAAPFTATGQLRVTSTDISPLLQATGIAYPDPATRLPADLTSDLDWHAQQLDLRGLKGTFAETALSGFLAYGLQDGTEKLTGDLDFEKSSAAALLELALGAPQPAKAGFFWSDFSFNAGLSDAPPVKLTLRAKSFDILPGLPGTGAVTQFETAPGIFTFRDFSIRTGGGDAAGTIRLRREGTNAALTGHLEVKNYGLNWPSLTGSMSAGLEVSGSGPNALALISSLAGSGQASITGLSVQHADPGALTRIFTETEQDKFNLNERDLGKAFSRELDRGALNAGQQPFDLSLATGVLHLTPKALKEAGKPPVAIDDLSLSLDLRDGVLDQRVEFALLALPKDWQGTPPHLTVDFNGSLANPARTIETADFVNPLAARAIARETARIQAFEFDLHERAVFNQRLQTEHRHDTESKAEEDTRGAADAARKSEETAKLEKQRKAEETRKEEIRKKLNEPLRLTPQSPLPINPKSLNSSKPLSRAPDPKV